MSTQYFCKNERRRQVLRDSSLPRNGIDFLEVLDTEAPPGTARQQTLLVRMLKTDPWGLTSGNVQIEGGVRITSVKVLWVLRATEASDALVSQGQITEAEKDFFLALPEPDHVLVVRTSADGDFSPYRLRLVQSSTNQAPPDGFDPILAEVTFSFKVECPSEFDCQTENECPPAALAEPVIDYLAKDYASFRQLMLDRLSVIAPEWQERNPADLGITIIELLAYTADYLSYYQDAAATEAYLGTARRRVSVRRHARLLDYPMHDGCNARTWVQVWVDANNVTLPAKTQLFTEVTGYAQQIEPDSLQYAQALAQQPVVFETMRDVTCFVDHNQIPFYIWGDEMCCLPAGATRATLQGNLPNLQVGDVLIFIEALGPDTGHPADADPAHRHAVRLSAVTVTEDPLGGQFLAEPTDDPVPVTEIEWMAEDALPFPLCLSTEHTSQVSVALGNIVLADHGQTITGETLAPPPGAPLARGRYRPRLEGTNITHCTSYAEDDDGLQGSASAVLIQEVRQALPWVELTGDGEIWHPQRDLLNSSRFAAEFVVEMESDGRAYLRFGDGVFGRPPSPGAVLTATYRIGNGRTGNVGADAITHVVTADSNVVAVRNPLAAQGGVNPESMEEVRLYAPQAFRTQERAVTEADYAEVAQRHIQVQRAVARRRWTGSWYTMFLTVDRTGGRPVDADFEAELRAFLERYRLAGQDLEIDGPRFVPLDIAFVVCVEAGYFASDVKAALLETFSNRTLPAGRRGFFHPDNFTFGQPVYLSQVVAAAMEVPGVRWLDLEQDPAKPNRFQRWGEPPHGELVAGQIDMDRLEIARLDNDPNAPENGKLEFIMQGGL